MSWVSRRPWCDSSNHDAENFIAKWNDCDVETVGSPWREASDPRGNAKMNTEDFGSAALCVCLGVTALSFGNILKEMVLLGEMEPKV